LCLIDIISAFIAFIFILRIFSDISEITDIYILITSIFAFAIFLFLGEFIKVIIQIEKNTRQK